MAGRTKTYAALGLAAIAALTSTGALAKPIDPVATRATAHAGAIIFTNPLGRSRGPGAGAGLL
jgi:hypothetical protein